MAHTNDQGPGFFFLATQKFFLFCSFCLAFGPAVTDILPTKKPGFRSQCAPIFKRTMARFKCTPSNMVKLTVAVVANLFASAALALGVATNYWKKTSTLDVHYGLWEFSLRGTTCPIDDSCVLGTSCMVLDPNTRGLSNCSYFNAVRGLAIIATMIALAATALQFCFAIGRTTRRAWLLNFLSGMSVCF